MTIVKAEAVSAQSVVNPPQRGELIQTSSILSPRQQQRELGGVGSRRWFLRIAALAFGGAALTGGSIAVADAATDGAVSRFLNSLLGQPPPSQDQTLNIPIPPNQTSASVTPTTSAVAQSQPTQVAGDGNDGKDAKPTPPSPAPSSTVRPTVDGTPRSTPAETSTPRVKNYASILSRPTTGFIQAGDDLKVENATGRTLISGGVAIALSGPTIILFQVANNNCPFLGFMFYGYDPATPTPTPTPTIGVNDPGRFISVNYGVLNDRKAVSLVLYNGNQKPQNIKLSDMGIDPTKELQVNIKDYFGKTVGFSNPGGGEVVIDLAAIYGPQGLFPKYYAAFGIQSDFNEGSPLQSCSARIINPRSIR